MRYIDDQRQNEGEMVDQPAFVIEGRVSRKANNALRMDFLDSSGSAVASALQSGADSRRARTSILMGWRNGGQGRHLVTFADGAEVIVGTPDDSAAAPITQRDGGTLGAIEPGPPCAVRGPSGAVVLSVAPGPSRNGAVPDARKEPARKVAPLDYVLRDASGADLGRIADIRDDAEWSLKGAFMAAADVYAFITASGAQSVPIKRAGCGILLTRPPTSEERVGLVALAVDLAIGLRDYA